MTLVLTDNGNVTLPGARVSYGVSGLKVGLLARLATGHLETMLDRSRSLSRNRKHKQKNSMKPAVAEHEEGGVAVVETELVALTQSEKKRLATLETEIKEGLSTFVDVGAALSEIREQRLYREKFDTFNDYCVERWGLTKTHANRQIAASSVAITLKPTPMSESVVRPLVKLTPSRQQSVWKRAVKKAGEPRRVTATLVQQIVAGRKINVGTPTHRVVPDDLIKELDAWFDENRADLSQLDVEDFFRRVKNKIRKA